MPREMAALIIESGYEIWEEIKLGKEREYE